MAYLREKFQAIKSLRSRNGVVGYPEIGLYHFDWQSEDERSRIHLRIEEAPIEGGMRGTLLVNANRVYQLNPTAAFMAYLALSQMSDEQAIRSLARYYRASHADLYSDYAQFCAEMEQLIRPDGACPICDLDIEVTAPFSALPSAPYRMDLALTYRCNDDCAHCYNARPRGYPEISNGEWKKIIEQVRSIGIPHIVFTGGEPTLRDDLPELVAYASNLGLICGMNSNGRRLSDRNFLQLLVNAGLDHVQITVESHDPEIHDTMVRRKGAWKQTIAGLRNALDLPLYVMTNTTMLRQNSPFLGETLDFLAGIGVPTIGLNALIYAGNGLTAGTGLVEQELPALLDLARQKTDQYGQRLIWYTPTQYCHFDPVQLELGVKGCTAARYNMCVEPDGAILPCQSYYQPLGNLLRDSWDSIWNHSLARSLRERSYVQEKCRGCSLLNECGGGCPLENQAKTADFVSLDSIVLASVP
jgi:radical SAM protein with 4Fe4S-binding SPASM domain